MSFSSHPYSGLIAGLATQHHKLPLVGPAITRATGLRVLEAIVDTDALGTFTGEVPRRGSQWETAVAKARLGMELMELPLGLANEGSFAPLEAMPLLTADTELVVFVDDRLGIVVGEAEVDLMPPAIAVEVAGDEVERIPLVEAAFPEHGLIVRPVDGWVPVVKGVHELSHLTVAVAECAAASPVGRARVESDFRAHHHPRRREVIGRAAQRLARRLAMLCPACRAPGWGVDRLEAGAPCSVCRVPTRMPVLEHWRCGACDTTDVRETHLAAGVDPAHCPSCNP